MLIPVGIHDNLVLSDKTKINDKGSLELVIKSIESPDAILEALTNNVVLSSLESNYRFFTPSMDDFNKVKKSAADLIQELTTRRHQYTQYALLFAPREEVDKAIGGMAMFEGLGIPPEDYAKAVNMITNEDFLKKVDTNLGNKFVAFLKAKNAFDGTKPFRQKLPRASKNKVYSGISKSSYDVWIEPMDIPKAQSKIAFTEYEISSNLNHGNPIASDGAQATMADANKAKSLFKKPDAQDIPSQETSTEADKPSLFTKKGE